MLVSQHRCRVPEVPFHEAIFFDVRDREDKVAVVLGEGDRRSYTYRQLYEAIYPVGSALVKLGLTKGDVVALYLPNNLEMVLGLLGTVAIGGIVTCINSNYKAYELKYQLIDSQAKAIVTLSKNVPTVKRVMSEAKSDMKVKNIITVDQRVPGCLFFHDLLNDDCSAYPYGVSFNVREDTALIMYSSGTTGFPKGVIIPHYSIVAHMMVFTAPNLLPPIPTGEQYSTLMYLPLFHMFGLSVLFCFLQIGGKLVLQNGFQPEKFLAGLQGYKINCLYAVPPIILFMGNSPLLNQYDLSSLLMVRSAAAPLSAEAEDRLKSRLNIDAVYQGYGMSEMTAFVSIEPIGKAKSGSSGPLVTNTRAKIVNATTGEVMSANGEGEVYLHGLHMMKGYLNKPKANAEAIDKDGWFRTGDVGYYDEEGYLYITGRVKELIKYKGFQVAPAELEGLLITHPAVADAAVIGMPDTVAGEIPRAFIVKKPNTDVNEQEIQNFVKENLIDYKRLRGGVQFVSVIPKSASGKILRLELKKLLKKSNL